MKTTGRLWRGLCAVVLVAAATAVTSASAEAAGRTTGGGGVQVANGTDRLADADTAPCFPPGSGGSCQSTDPHVFISFITTGDTTPCTFAVDIDWGDGSDVQHVVLTGPPGNSTIPLADHVYAQPGTYTINGVTTLTAGNCTTNDGMLEFTLLPASTPANLVAMGDSYSSGNGTGRATGTCVLSPQAWPNLVPGLVNATPPSTVRISPTIIQLACSGASSDGQSPHGRIDLPAQITALSSIQSTLADKSVVTITIGGDDGRDIGAGFFNIMVKCFVRVPLEACARLFLKEHAWLRNREPALLRRDFEAITQAAPATKLYVVGYPLLFTIKHRCLSLAPEDLAFLNLLTHELNNDIRNAAAAVPGVTYVDETDAFHGHELCSSDPYVVAPFSFHALSAWFHPNKRGQGAIAARVAPKIQIG